MQFDLYCIYILCIDHHLYTRTQQYLQRINGYPLRLSKGFQISCWNNDGVFYPDDAVRLDIENPSAAASVL